MNGTVIRWDAATGRRLGDLAAGRVSSVPVLQSLAADAGGRRLMMVRDGEVLLWDISELEPRLSARFPTCASTFVLSPDGRRLLTIGDRGHTRLYSADDGRPIGPPLVPDLDLWAGDFLPDGRTVVLGIQPNRIRFYDLASGRPIGPALTHEGLASVPDGKPSRALRTAPDGRSVASLYNGWIKLWDVPGTIEAEADDERLVASAEALTGLSIDARGEIAALAPAAWRERLESGDAGLLGRRRSIDDWHDRNAARAELLGPPETALWHLERLGAARPGDDVVRLRLARARESSGESAGAAAGRAAARRLGPGEAVSTWLLHDAADRFRDAARAGRWPEAAAALDEVMDAAPDDISAHALRGEVRARLGRWSEAAEDLAVAAAAEPANHWFAHFHALTLLAAGDRAGYRAACARVLAAADLDPDPIAANYLAWACALGPDAVDDFERPIGMVRAAPRRVPRLSSEFAPHAWRMPLPRRPVCRGHRGHRGVDRLHPGPQRACGLGVPGHGPPSARPSRRRPPLAGSFRRIPPARPALRSLECDRIPRVADGGRGGPGPCARPARSRLRRPLSRAAADRRGPTSPVNAVPDAVSARWGSILCILCTAVVGVGPVQDDGRRHFGLGRSGDSMELPGRRRRTAISPIMVWAFTQPGSASRTCLKAARASSMRPQSKSTPPSISQASPSRGCRCSQRRRPASTSSQRRAAKALRIVSRLRSRDEAQNTAPRLARVARINAEPSAHCNRDGPRGLDDDMPGPPRNQSRRPQDRADRGAEVVGSG